MRSRLIAVGIACLVIASMAVVALAGAAGRSRAPEAYTAGVEQTTQLPGTATLLGRVQNHGLPTSWRFKWGSTETYGHITEAPEERAFDGGEPVGVESGIEGLRPGRTYHYRLVAVTSAGKSIGEDRTFRAVPRGLWKGG
jgi:phosphodiesterase/alkaline phosphatase D-like protein